MVKKTVWIGLTVVVIVVTGVSVWWVVSSFWRQIAPQHSSQPAVERTDLTATNKPTVAVRDLSFTPANIKVKLGATVVWTNNDGVNHALVADDAAKAGGLPTDQQNFGKNSSVSVTFKKLGTFSYHCGVHSFMHGSVEVVE